MPTRTPAEVDAYLADSNSDKKAVLIDRLLQRPEHASYFALKWADILQNRGAGYSTSQQRAGTTLFAAWIRDSIAANKRYDQFVSEIITASGSQAENPPAIWYRTVRKTPEYVESVSQAFLGVRVQCAQCHHHPTEKWDLTDYYQMAAFFTQMKRKGQGISAPISGEPEQWWFSPGTASIEHPVTKVSLKPRPPADKEIPIAESQDPRAVLADWMTNPKNPHFAHAIVNRVWSSFMGRGIVDPVDDFRASNPPTNPALLDWLAADFVQHGYDLKHLMRTIMRSQIYRLSSLPNDTNAADLKNYSRSYRRRR